MNLNKTAVFHVAPAKSPLFIKSTDLMPDESEHIHYKDGAGYWGMALHKGGGLFYDVTGTRQINIDNPFTWRPIKHDNLAAWLRLQPIGISCAAITTTHGTWLYMGEGHQMAPDEAGEIHNDLLTLVKGGYKIITWGGLAFDFRLLAQAVGSPEPLAIFALAFYHIDMLYHFFCANGYPLTADSAAQGTNIIRPGDDHRNYAPYTWSKGNKARLSKEVLKWSKGLLMIYLKSLDSGTVVLPWQGENNEVNEWTAEEWLNVPRASQLPERDYTGLANFEKLDRADFYGWAAQALGLTEVPLRQSFKPPSFDYLGVDNPIPPQSL